jgi:hypothetical protein
MEKCILVSMPNTSSLSVEIPTDTHMAAKMAAISEGLPLKRFVTEALVLRITQTAKAKKRTPLVPMGDSRAPKKRA